MDSNGIERRYARCVSHLLLASGDVHRIHMEWVYNVDAWVGQGLADLIIVHNLYTCIHLMNTFLMISIRNSILARLVYQSSTSYK